MELNIMTWNVNFQSDNSVKIAKFVQEIIKKEMFEDVHIVVFTEIIKNKSVIELMNNWNNFDFYESDISRGNQIIIAVRKDIAVGKDIIVSKVVNKIPNVPEDSSPNFMHIEIILNDNKYQIIGSRIRIDSKASKEDYKNRKKQFKTLKNYLSNLDNIIVIGDFNNSMIHGNLFDDYNKMKHLYEQKEYSKHFNYHMMKEIMKFDLNIHTPESGFSWGLSYDRKKDVYSYGYIKNDHLMVSKNLHVSNIEYNWEFVKDNNTNYLPNDFVDKYGNSKVNVKKGYPDHATLYAKIEL